MIFEYDLIGNLGKNGNPNTSALYFIGAMMFLGGLGKVIWEIQTGNGFLSIVLPIITLMGGISFLIVANRNKKLQKNTVKYSIQISDEKVIAKYGNDSKVNEMFTGEISKIDFNSKDIHISGKDNSKIVVDLELISPEKKKNELIVALKNILKNNKIQESGI